MPLYKFDFTYTARGSRYVELEDDDEAKHYGWDHAEDLTTDPMEVYDVDIDDSDVEISEADPDTYESKRYLYED